MPAPDGCGNKKEGEIMRGLLYNQFRTFRMPLICISVMSVVSLIATIGDSQNSYSEDFWI